MAATDRLESNEDFLMTLVRLQDEDLSLHPLWEVYGHDQNLLPTIVDSTEAMSIE